MAAKSNTKLVNELKLVKYILLSRDKKEVKKEIKKGK
jgi:hypothetical protein